MAPTLDPVAEFWNREAAAFTARDGKRRSYHLEFGQILNARLSGQVLCVGGLYDYVELESERFAVTVVDVSERMLEVYAARGARARLGDARQLPLPDESVDHVVFPLVLHHITGATAAQSRENVRIALREARRVLRPGGQVWVKEIVVPAPVYLVERVVAPVTRMLLGSRGIPLVIFHSTAFFMAELQRAGLEAPEATNSEAVTGHWYDLVRPVIGLQLRVPRCTIPVDYVLLRAARPAARAPERSGGR